MAHDLRSKPFRVEMELRQGVALLSLFGPLDMFAASLLERKIHIVEVRVRRVILDLRGLTELASSGAAVIVRAQNRSSVDGWALTIVRGPPAITAALRASPLARRLFMIDSPEGPFADDTSGPTPAPLPA